MSQLLLADLTALSNESKRKSPDVKAAADLALSNLRADFEGTLSKCKGSGVADASGSYQNRRGSAASPPLRNNLEEAEIKSLLEDNLILKPIFLSCNAKTHVKVTILGVALLQRIVAMQVVPSDAVSPLISLLTPLLAKGDVELQLKLLQTFSAFLLSYPSIHGDLLANIINLCFRLQDSKIQVVSSTAAATVRQVVMIVFEKVGEEDRVLDGIKEGGEDAAVAAPLAISTIDVPDTEGVTLFPSSSDAYNVLLDLNSLAQEEPANFIKLASLPRTFTLELIESVLTNHAQLVRTHPELLYTLRRSTCPLLIRALSEKLVFPSTLRFLRLLFVTLRQFSSELVVEVEILVNILLRFIESANVEGAAQNPHGAPRWQTIVALEVTRSLCSDGKFIRNLWQWFDGKESSAKVFSQLVYTLKDIVLSESSMIGAVIPEEDASRSASARPSIDRQATGFGLYEAAAGMASAVFSTSGSQNTDDKTTLGLHSAPSIQFVDQLEKAEPPTAPTTYILLLSAQSLVHLAQSLAQYVLPAYSQFVNARQGNQNLAPPRMDLAQLPDEQSRSMAGCKAMIELAQKPLGLALFLLLSSRVEDAIFCEILTAVRNWTNTCGVLGLDQARDAFIKSLGSLATLPGALIEMEDAKDDNDGRPTERNLAACRVLVHVSIYLSGILDDHWLPALTAICETEYLIRRAMTRRSSVVSQSSTSASHEEVVPASPSKRSIAPSAFQPGFSLASSPHDSKTGRPQLLSGLDHGSLLKEIDRCFENSTALDLPAFQHFLRAVCSLSGTTAQRAHSTDETPASTPLSTPSKNQKSTKPGAVNVGPLSRPSKGGLLAGSVVLADLKLVVCRNIERLAQENVEVGWKTLTSQLLSICSDNDITASIRVQAAEVLAALLTQSIELTASGQAFPQAESERCQGQVFHSLRPLSVQADKTSSGDLQVRQVGVKALQEIVEKYGHGLRLGWEVIFEIVVAACHNGTASPSVGPVGRPTNSSLSSKGTLPLLKTAFAAVQLICNDLLAALNLPQLKLCIDAIVKFAVCDDVNTALTAASSFWSVTAELASRSPSDGQAGLEIIDLWMCLLAAFKTTALDERPEVRDASISGLFRVLGSYGSILHSKAWSQAFNQVVFPLIENVMNTTQAASKSAAAATASSAAVVSPQKERGRRTSSTTQGIPQPPIDKQWQETCVVAFQQVGNVVGDYLHSRIVHSEDFQSLWEALLAKLKAAFLSGPASVSQAAINCLLSMVRGDVPAKSDDPLYEPISRAWQSAWKIWANIAQDLPNAPTTFTQANLVAFVELFPFLIRCQPESIELQAADLLQKTIVYTKSGDATNDIDSPTRLQAITLQTIRGLKEIPGIPSKTISILAERISLPFTLGASTERGPHPTYVAVHKDAVQQSLSCYEAWQGQEEIYTSGALNALLSALAVPIKLRYECPASFKYPSSDKSKASPRPLWQEATLALCTIIPGICGYIKQSGDSLSEDHYCDVWRQLLNATQAVFEADCTALQPVSTSGQALQSSISYETAMEDQSFDLALLSIFEMHVWPLLGGVRTPSNAIQQFGQALSRASKLFDERSLESLSETVAASALEPVASPRELVSFACLDLLFLICSDRDSRSASVQEDHRVAALTTSALLQRVSTTLRQYVADARLRGGAPFPRLRDEEVFAILSHLLDLTVRNHTLSAALDQDPSKYVSSFYSDGGEDQKKNEAQSIKALSQQSPRAVLFALHGPLCDLLALPSHTPSLAASTTGGSQLIHPLELTRHTPSPPSGFQYSGRIGHINVLSSEREDREEPKRLQDLAHTCLEIVGEAL
ncbi:unnamed protein product [Sympodiomycopsis kandeliae]